jgi:hypothetical protein
MSKTPTTASSPAAVVAGMPWSCAADTKWLLMIPFVVQPQTKNVPASSRKDRVQNASRSTVTAWTTACGMPILGRGCDLVFHLAS